MFAVTGKSTTYNKQLELLAGESAEPIDWPHAFVGMRYGAGIPRANRFVLAGGILCGKSIHEMDVAEAFDTCNANLATPLRICELILRANESARICVVGSHSSETGSFDQLYAATKAGLEQYVRTRECGPGQLLCCVSPTIIADSGMTERRPDYPEVLEKRFTLRAVDVARVIFEMLWTPEPFEEVRRINQNRVRPVVARLAAGSPS